MYNKVIFYNHFGAGDVFESREFVRDWMKLIPADSYVYAHGKHPRLLLDMPELVYDQINKYMLPTNDVWDDLNGHLYVNTWIGRNGKYVLPGIGCVVEELFKMHNDMLSKKGLQLTKTSPYEYIPDIDYSYYDKSGVDFFVWEHPGKKVLFSNGFCQSSQANNFDMNTIISDLAEEFEDVCFIVAQDYWEKPQNVYSTDHIIGGGKGTDLNEISYLSTFCDILVGRNSGPHVYSQVKRNWDDESKTLVSFTYTLPGSSFVLSTEMKMKKKWSSSVDFFNVRRFIEETINA